MSDSNLKPCPFCGSDNLELACDSSAWFVRCNECEAVGSAVTGDIDNDDVKAVEAWNLPIRTPDAFERAAQLCRYYLKHQNYPAWEMAGEYERGVIVACENLEKIMVEEGRNSLATK